MTKDETRAAILAILTTGEGMTPDNVADAICSALFPGEAPAAPLNEGSRDETEDSIDPATGTLTAEAVAKRAADQAAADAADAEAAEADTEEKAAEDAEAAAETALSGAKDKQAAKRAAADAADATLAADPVGNVTTAADLQG